MRRSEYRSIGVTDSLHLPLRNVYTSTVHTYLLQDVARRYYHCHYCTIYRTRTDLRCTTLHYVLRYSTVQYSTHSILPPSKIHPYPADSAILQTQKQTQKTRKDKKKKRMLRLATVSFSTFYFYFLNCIKRFSGGFFFVSSAEKSTNGIRYSVIRYLFFFFCLFS